jgi:hypothetical protein
MQNVTCYKTSPVTKRQQSTVLVPDPGSRDRDVVLVKRGACWGNPRGGWEFGLGRDCGGSRKGEISLQATWDQGGQGRITPKEGLQVSKGE